MTLFAALCLPVGGAALSTLGAGAATATPTVVATPNSNLADGQYLRITFSGFAPQQAFDFRECIASPVNVATDCTAILPPNNPVTAVADKQGSGSTYVPVYDGTDQLLENSGGTGPLTCDDTHPCTIAAMPDTSNLTTSVLAPISFAPSPDLCPPQGPNAALGSGAAPAYRAMYAWEAEVCTPPENLQIGYTLKNSPDGVSNFSTGLTNFGVTGPWAPNFTPSSPTQKWDYAPLTMSGVVIAYRLYDLRGPQITTLTLSPDEIAQIFSGQLPDLATDPGVAALNPGIEFPPVLNTFVRAEHSAESWVFSSWLAQAAPTTWKYGANEIFPAPFGVIGVTGSTGVGFDVITNPNETFAGQGTIGYMDSSTAAYYGLPTVNIAWPDGTVTSANATSIAKAVSEATLNSDGTVSPGSGDETAWPMLMPTLMMVPTNNVTPTIGKEIASFLRYVVGPQGALPASSGYVPLTSAMMAKSDAAAAAIPITAPSPTPSPSPSAHGGFGSNGTAGFASPGALFGSESSPAATPLPSAHATPAAHTTTTVARPEAATLGGDPAQLVMPGVLAGGILALLGGAATELVGRIRRRRAATESTE